MPQPPNVVLCPTTERLPVVCSREQNAIDHHSFIQIVIDIIIIVIIINKIAIRLQFNDYLVIII
jgi:hypothetical protein